MKLTRQPWLEDAKTQRLLRAFAAKAIELRFVGGCVRDAIMGRPVGDIDCATPAPPKIVMELLDEAGLKAVPTGIAHGTVTAVVDGKPFEITTLRRDVACDGRHATVDYTNDWQEDAQRRDFTLNALYCEANGEVYDYTDGVKAAQAGRIQFIGDANQRIQEDALRILRFFRFYATHGRGEPDATALAACAKHKTMLQHLSGERIQQEMLKLLGAPEPAIAVQAMQAHGILDMVIPHCDTTLIAAPVATPHPLLRAAMLIGLDKDEEALATRWKLSNRDRDLLHQLVHHPDRSWPSDDYAILRTARHLPQETYALLLCRNAVLNDITPETVYATLSAAEALEMPRFPVNGDDLIQAGIPPGPELGQKLKALEAYWEEQRYEPDKGELMKQLSSRM